MCEWCLSMDFRPNLGVLPPQAQNSQDRLQIHNNNNNKHNEVLTEDENLLKALVKSREQ